MGAGVGGIRAGAGHGRGVAGAATPPVKVCTNVHTLQSSGLIIGITRRPGCCLNRRRQRGRGQRSPAH
jgi:hypothetical protein